MADLEELKRQAGFEAAKLVTSGMRIGYGTGSTAKHFMDAVAARIAAGELTDVIGVPTSKSAIAQAERLGIRLSTLNETPEIDLTVDGVDEVSQTADGRLVGIKGGGGAHLWEKMVAAVSRRWVGVADARKVVSVLGAFPLPVEVSPHAWAPAKRRLEKLGCEAVLRGGTENPYPTDHGNVILDCAFGTIPDPFMLNNLLNADPLVLAHGLFIGLIDEMIIAEGNGITRIKGRR